MLLLLCRFALWQWRLCFVRLNPEAFVLETAVHRQTQDLHIIGKIQAHRQGFPQWAQTLIDAKQQRNLEAPSGRLCWHKRNQLACATHHKDDDPGDFVLQAQRVPPVAELAGPSGAGWISIRLQAAGRILLRRTLTARRVPDLANSRAFS